MRDLVWDDIVRRGKTEVDEVVRRGKVGVVAGLVVQRRKVEVVAGLVAAVAVAGTVVGSVAAVAIFAAQTVGLRILTAAETDLGQIQNLH